jgi:serine/threonine protein kinase
MYNHESLFATRYELQQRIGIGAFAEVWHAVDTMTKREVAIKIFAPDKGIDDSGLDLFLKEYNNAYELYHPHLLRIDHFDVNNGSPYLVMPYCKEGSLARKKQSGYVFTERDMALITMQIADALMYLHGRNFSHRDMKPENILILDDDHYVLSDFGISTGMRRTLEKTMGYNPAKFFTGTFVAPEYFDGDTLNSKSDIFSFGVSLYELANGSLPYPEMGQAVKHGYSLPNLPQPDFGYAFSMLIKNCLDKNPDDRPDATDLYQWAKFFLNHGYWDVHNMGKKNLPISGFDQNQTAAALHEESPNTQIKPEVQTSSKKDYTIPIIAASAGVVLIGLIALLIWLKPFGYDTDKVIAQQLPAYEELKKLDLKAAETLALFLAKNPSLPAKKNNPSADIVYTMKDLQLLPKLETDTLPNFAILRYKDTQPILVCLLRPKTNPAEAQLIALYISKKAQYLLREACTDCAGIQMIPPNRPIAFINPTNRKVQEFIPTDTVALAESANIHWLFYQLNGTSRKFSWKTDN